MIIRMEQVGNVTAELVQKLIERDKVLFLPEDEKMRRYYEGQHAIMERKFSDPTKPNNKIVTNFCKYIVRTNVGYFVGKPVRYSSTDKEYMERLQEIFDENDEQSVNSRLAKYAAIYGRAAEILYVEQVDGKAKVRFEALDPTKQRVVVVYDTSVRPRILLALRYFDVEDVLDSKKIQHAYVYTDREIWYYMGEEGKLEIKESRKHYFGEVPINVYFNTDEDEKGDFADIITLNDAYNALQSDDVNESDYSNDAYLVISGLTADDEDIAKMKERRVIELTGDGQSSAQWLIKEINDTWKENLKKRIKQDIHLISGTPDMSDEKFAGNISGVAIEYKLVAFENHRAAKERAFKKALQRRIRLITNVLNKQGNNFDPSYIEITFSKNLPTDDEKIIKQVTELLGTDLVSKDTLRSQIPWIDDASYEAEKVALEQEGYTINQALADMERERMNEEAAEDAETD